MKKFDLQIWSIHVTNVITALFGVVLILISIIVGMDKTISVILLSIGTSTFASAIVSFLNYHYLIRQNNATQIVDMWGINKIYSTRAEINVETNELLKHTKKLEMCAMGLKGFRDAQGKTIEERVKEGMFIKILTLDPDSQFPSIVDKTEGLMVGSTKTDIISLIEWVDKLKKTANC
ncbi:MAG: hypothetical protein IJ410_04830 [Oscillospiraceae bacterium]|nr:hypothetical protein [Oscillospiraceae bacterium]